MSDRQTLITLCVASFLGNVSFSLLFPVLPYHAQGMGASASQVGLILAGYSYVSAISLVPSERWGETLGWFTVATQSALVVGPALGGLLLNHYGFQVAFYSCSIIPLAGLFLVLLRLRAIHPASAEIRVSSSFAWLKQPAVFAGLIGPLFFTIGSGTIFTFMPLYSQALGISETMAGIIIATLYLGSTLLGVPGGKLSDKICYRSFQTASIRVRVA